MQEPTYVCQVCAGLLLVPEKRPGPRRSVCSDECSEERARRRARAWYAEHRDDLNLKARVAEAARRQHVRAKADPALWRARLDATARWREGNGEALSEQYREWRLANADKVRAKVQRRRARLLGAWVEDVDPADIWKRDCGICGICHDAIDPDLQWPHKMSKTLDHIVPLAKGGTHERANVQLAHAVCNARKGHYTIQ